VQMHYIGFSAVVAIQQLLAQTCVRPCD
jgi:hypothetical protein